MGCQNDMGARSHLISGSRHDELSRKISIFNGGMGLKQESSTLSKPWYYYSGQNESEEQRRINSMIREGNQVQGMSGEKASRADILSHNSPSLKSSERQSDLRIDDKNELCPPEYDKQNSGRLTLHSFNLDQQEQNLAASEQKESEREYRNELHFDRQSGASIEVQEEEPRVCQVWDQEQKQGKFQLLAESQQNQEFIRRESNNQVQVGPLESDTAQQLPMLRGVHHNHQSSLLVKQADGKIITPSFTSEQAKRASDILLQKRESSCLARQSVDSASRDPFLLRESNPRRRLNSRPSRGKKSPFHTATMSGIAVGVSNDQSDQPKSTTNVNFRRNNLNKSGQSNTMKGFKSKQSSSNVSRRSIVVNRKSVEGDYQEVSGFAAYMAKFVQNFFSCCAGTQAQEMEQTLRASNISSGGLHYSFMADPLSPQFEKEEKLFVNSFAQNPLEEANLEAKSSFKSAFTDDDPDPDQDLRENIGTNEKSEYNSAQKPIDTVIENRFRPPGTHINACNYQSKTSVDDLRITVGSITTAKQTSAEILAQSPGGEENYKSGQTAEQLNPFSPQTEISAMNTKVESGVKTSDIKASKSQLEFSDKQGTQFESPSQPPSTIADEHDPIRYNEDDDVPLIENSTAKKRTLKDMVTKVPKAVQNQTKSTHENEGIEEASSGEENVEDDKVEIEVDSDNYGNEEDDEQPDVQKAHFNQTVTALYNIRALRLDEPPIRYIQHLMVNLPPFNAPHKTKTIVFDLDETLIHCVDDIDTENPDVIIPLHFTGETEPVMAGINIRPYAKDCLKAANQNFQVVIFTASEQEYADPIIDYLDPTGELVQARFYRPNCFRKNDFYVKDMRIFQNRDLSDIVLIDNSVYSFAFQLDNGVPIVSYYDDQNDEEMLHLKFYLECLKDCEDVREKNIEAFQLIELAETQMELIEERRLEEAENESDEDEIMWANVPLDK